MGLIICINILEDKNMRTVVQFIKDNPLQEGEFYNHLDGSPPIFAVCRMDSDKIIKHISVDTRHIYFVDDGVLYAENTKTEKTRKLKI